MSVNVESIGKVQAAVTDEVIIEKVLNRPLTEGNFLSKFGPGIITGASDDDPSGIGTYCVAGAAFGFSTLWTVLLVFPLMTAVQYSCAKIGMVTGTGLTAVLRKHYHRGILYPLVFLLVLANSINAGADISAIASAFNLILPVPVSVLIIPVALAILSMQFLGSYKLIASVFKWLTLALFAYVATAFFIKLDPLLVARGTFMPNIKFDGAFITMLLAILGTSISPYLFFWQADQEVEEKISAGQRRLWQRRGCEKHQLRSRLWDIKAGMFFATVVMYFVILVSGATLFGAGHHNINSATEAAMALRPLAGEYATLLFALGIIGSGFLAVPILTTSGAYALSQMYGWKHGLDHKFHQAKEFYAVISISTILGMIIPALGVNPISALFWTAVINGLVAIPLLFMIMLIANNKKIMGAHTNGLLTNVFGWAAAVVMFAAGIGMLFLGGS
jgi:NRAMP (natural resistance-associated macrophage protein)-like metal ion transporter